MKPSFMIVLWRTLVDGVKRHSRSASACWSQRPLVKRFTCPIKCRSRIVLVDLLRRSLGRIFCDLAYRFDDSFCWLRALLSAHGRNPNSVEQARRRGKKGRLGGGQRPVNPRAEPRSNRRL